MNRALLQKYLVAYKQNFAYIRSEENYKWQAIQHFQDHWDPKAEDFAAMLTQALAETKNLMNAGNYFPKRMILKAVKARPLSVRRAFNSLFDETDGLEERILAFRQRIKNIIALSEPKANAFQDDRAILVYLSLRYPEKYFLYKFEMFNNFCQQTEYDYTPKPGAFANITHYFEACFAIKELILSDSELVQLHIDHLSATDYPDTEFNVLVQDVIFAIDYHLPRLEKIAQSQLTTTPLSAQARAVLGVLVNHIKQGGVQPAEPQTFIGYKQVHDLLDLPFEAHAYGKSLERQGLGALAEWTQENGLPAITGLVIDWGYLMPGPGYFNLYGKSREDFHWWRREIEKSIEFDWSPFVPASIPPSDEPKNQNKNGVSVKRGGDVPIADYFAMSKAADSEEAEPPDRVETTAYRIIRDTKKAIWVKTAYRFRCQVCNETVALSDRNYSEAHHIKPLGKPHNGPDVIENIISLCPNHHAMFDYGAMELDLAALTLHPAHRLNSDYINYHNQEIYKGNGKEK